MSAAAQSVESTTELLELILIEMDMQTLLVTASRVCRRWQYIINNTRSIQRALFFLPEQKHEGAADDVPYKELNPLLTNPNPASFEDPQAFTPPPKPGIFNVNFWPVTGRLGFLRLHEMALEKTTLEKNSSKSVDTPFLHPTASWRRMYTSQPPCNTITVVSHRGAGVARPDTRKSFSSLTGVSEYGKGMSMGDLYDLTEKHCLQQPADGFLIISLAGIKR
ncbi:hypothetical protein G7046_g2305 [Stylonectria norvegica]|nr:hypothetical protein G7046_g2305 [Stylonectria norvegica]